MKPREFYEARAKAIIKVARDEKRLSYKELARRLSAVGVRVNQQVLINRINRGRFTFAFALQLLAAMDVQVLQVPRLPSALAQPKR